VIPSQELALGGGIAALLAAAFFGALRRRARRVAETIAYLRGVHYVLSDAPEAAIGELTRAAALNPNAATSSIETYFALGKLFRRKGDLEHAIRLHQNILLQPGLPVAVKRQAQLELAIDLHKAGLLGQAVEAYEKFLADEPTHAEALLQLRQVHEAARNPEAAAEVAVRAVKAGQGGASILSHLLATASACGHGPRSRACMCAVRGGGAGRSCGERRPARPGRGGAGAG
jgi:lipopolysaccharide biosynthesis regulator YciM